MKRTGHWTRSILGSDILLDYAWSAETVAAGAAASATGIQLATVFDLQ